MYHETIDHKHVQLIGQNELIECGSALYRIYKNAITKVTVTPGGEESTILCQCVIKIKEIVTIVMLDGQQKKELRGFLIADSFVNEFSITIENWINSCAFLAYFISISKGRFNPAMSDIDSIRHASIAYANVNGIFERKIFSSVGLQKETYFNYGVAISAGTIDWSNKETVALRDDVYFESSFQPCEPDQAAKVLLRIFEMFPKFWSAGAAFTCLAHCLGASVAEKFTQNRAALVIEGDVSFGLSYACMSFFGGSGILKNVAGFTFQDMLEFSTHVHDTPHLYVVGDTMLSNLPHVEKAIVTSADGCVPGQCDSRFRFRPKKFKASLLLVSNGKLAGDWCVGGRTVKLTLPAFKSEDLQTIRTFIMKESQRFGCFTPYFIKFCLSEGKSHLQNTFLEIKSDLIDLLYGQENFMRASSNYAHNFAVFSTLLMMAEKFGIISNTQCNLMRTEHLVYLKNLVSPNF